MSGFRKIDYQVDLADRIVQSLKGNDVALCSIPCGYGKTGIAYWVHKLYGQRSIILNHNRVLVDQYSDLYKDVDGITCLKGKANYLCSLYKNRFRKEVSVEIAPCQTNWKFKCEYKNSGECEYFRLRKEFDVSPLAITNYQLLLTLLDAGIYERANNGLIICDECHNIDSIFADYRTVRVNPSTVGLANRLSSSLVGLGMIEALQFKDYCNEAYKAMCEGNHRDCFEKFYGYLMKLENMGCGAIEEDTDGYLTKMKGEAFVTDMNESLSLIGQLTTKWRNYVRIDDKDNYVYQDDVKQDEGGDIHSYSLIPVNIGKLFRDTAKEVCYKIVLMSGTVVGKENMIRNLGIDSDKYGYVDVPSRFDVENRPVMFLNVAGLNKNNIQEGYPEYKNVIESMKTILEYHSEKEESGVIFVPSYYLGSRIYDSLENVFRKLEYKVFRNTSSEDAQSTLEGFYDLKVRKRILISPSFEEGVNFSDDISRFQIIVKTPYLFLGNNRVKEKMRLEPEWYEIASFTRIIQSSARSVRNTEDYAVTYVLDSNATRLYRKIKKDCPSWFNEAVVI